MKQVFSVDQIRRAENILLKRQSDPDELMISAAAAVAEVALAMIEVQAEPRLHLLPGGGPEQIPWEPVHGQTLLLVGPGGNGGDALYAGAFMIEEGQSVHAVLLGDGKVHESAVNYFLAQDGEILEEFPDAGEYNLVVDGVYGIGNRGPISVELANFMETVYSMDIPVLAVDVPSGVNADTGEVPPGTLVRLFHYGPDAPVARQKVPTHINATATITFGGLRRAHAVSPACGEVMLADIDLAAGDGHGLSQELVQVHMEDGVPPVYASVVVRPRQPIHEQVGQSEAGEAIQDIGQHFMALDLEPRPEHDKYSSGIVGIVAGSDAYRGAAILATQAAVRATSSMVRYVGSVADMVVQAAPEVVVTRTLADTGRVQTWVHGPGHGTSETEVAELADLLTRPEPLLIDADSLTLLATSPELRAVLALREAPTVLTPHKGEFERLAEVLRSEGLEIPSAFDDPIGAAQALSEFCGCCVLLKGRHTVVAAPKFTHVINAGSSWLATAGSGDVLAGLVGAHVAQSYAEIHRLPEFFPDINVPDTAVYTQVARAVVIHSLAGYFAADTAFGTAPTSASRIVECISPATAQLTTERFD
ncbi:Bifunctional NAD(P)H-hydrate repair enzyme Nnr [Corynebacterium deserti GIMN1.010]|uniref:ADP-dependent (S)-NAD(P)H-hydrate dehydratase n=1 Tax=Corynebacterium deserti GIMN1.010 TaxID=931089 RepID=A0A0M3Q955_9CORY|nr:bifunctional ADP-dependent NAD(P)H-hydrate dehydratase/NAD(P)H-hydrate epimerase [Corynebacterium deserti]ALC05069.1 Bifunctional NAD(P)H-hydrate repair enzyme Nnr [Corynebacterium deserti GIMN1.010]